MTQDMKKIFLISTLCLASMMMANAQGEEKNNSFVHIYLVLLYYFLFKILAIL